MEGEQLLDQVLELFEGDVVSAIGDVDDDSLGEGLLGHLQRNKQDSVRPSIRIAGETAHCGGFYFDALFVRADDVSVAPDAQSGPRVATDRGEELVHRAHREVPVGRQHCAEVAGRVLHLPLHHQRLTLNEVAMRRVRRLVVEFLFLQCRESKRNQVSRPSPESN